VRKDGTQIGFITFSNSTRTKKLLDVGEKTDATELIDWLKKLSYEGELMGDYTRTGLAFQIANNVSQRFACKNTPYLSSTLYIKNCHLLSTYS
jgi:hypothetical protein